MRRLLTLLPLLIAPATAHAQGLQGFVTPSKNIGCYVSADGARCDIRTHDWKTPQRPKSCRLDYGQGLEVEKSSKRGRFVCAGDTALGGGKVLGYGKSIRKGGLTCTSRESGVSCENAKGHGFRLSKQTYARF